jgi:hypothetical protein
MANALPKGTTRDDVSQTKLCEAETSGNVTHKTKNIRTNALNAVIKLAKTKAADSADYQNVWANLVSLAESKDRPAPLLGYCESEGVKYQGYSEVKFFNKFALRRRMKRAANSQ